MASTSLGIPSRTFIDHYHIQVAHDEHINDPLIGHSKLHVKRVGVSPSELILLQILVLFNGLS
jgi:hypothetical protein